MSSGSMWPRVDTTSTPSPVSSSAEVSSITLRLDVVGGVGSLGGGVAAPPHATRPIKNRLQYFIALARLERERVRPLERLGQLGEGGLADLLDHAVRDHLVVHRGLRDLDVLGLAGRRDHELDGHLA